ncbi:MAG: ribose 5-phosphate isomerase B [Alphaproteobacteria bacterium]|nr:ribose 5-phosphate isomerase B [Alphaproteobacteria bacterium]
MALDCAIMYEKRVYIASDHRGFILKTALTDWLAEEGFEIRDLGPDTDATRVDASDYALKVVQALKTDTKAFGILICGSGQAMTMTANRFQHIRCALCLNGYMAQLARQHNNANILALGAELTGTGLALDCAKIFLNTEALGGRYAERCEILTNLGGL